MNNDETSKKEHQEWLRSHNINTSHDYVKDIKGVKIWRFLSQLADHYGKNPYWITNQYKVYYGSFSRVPEEFLQRFLSKWLTEQNGIPLGSYKGYLPTVAHILEYFQSRVEWNKSWENKTRYTGEFCHDCKFYGGFRDLYIRWKDDRGRTQKQSIRAVCTCEQAKKVHKDTSYEDVVREYETKHFDVEICVSYYNQQEERLVAAVEQSAERYEKRVKLGYFGEDESGFYPIWEHKYWTTTFGLATADLEGLEMPADLRAKIEKALAKDRVTTKHNKQSRLRSMTNKDGKVDVPKSIGSYFGY